MKRICVLPGDGIGPEVIASAVRALESVTDVLEFEYAPIGLGEYQRTGKGISDDTLRMMKTSDSTLFGAVTSPQERDYISPVLRFRKELELFANVRPVKTLVQSPGKPFIDLAIIRENTEGMYTQNETVDERGVTTHRRITKDACERIVKFAFDSASSWGKRRVCCVHKANVLRRSDGLFLNIFREMSQRYEALLDPCDQLVDSAAMSLVTDPGRFEVIVTLNLYGDILSDVAAGVAGGLGFAPSGNIGHDYSVFEPCHGSAPDIAGKGIANPTAAILAGAMMLEHLGMGKESNTIRESILKTYSQGHRTIDIGGKEDTESFTDSVIRCALES